MKATTKPVSSMKMPNEDNKPLTQYIIVIRFFPSTFSYSFNIPCEWDIKRLRKFILTSFEEELNYVKFILLYKAKALNDDDVLLKDLFQLNQINHLNLILNNNKKEEDSNINNNKEQSLKTKTEIFQSEDFGIIENEVFKNYFESIASVGNNINEQQQQLHIDYSMFPFGHRNIAQRIEMINNGNTLEKLKSFELPKIENFPLKGFFQLDLLFRLFLLLIIFSHYFVKWNFPIFIGVLMFYYWHIVTNLINEHYKKKIEELHINQPENYEMSDEMHFEHTVPLNVDANEGEDDKKDEEPIHGKKKKKMKQKSINDIERTIEEEIEDQKENDKEEESGDVRRNKKKNNIEIELKDLTQKTKKKLKEKLREIHYKKIEERLGENANEEIKEMFRKRIDETLNDDDNKDDIPIINQSKSHKAAESHNINKIQQEQPPQKETLFKYISSLVLEVLYTFIITLVPSWCEAYELNHPLPVEANPNPNDNNNNNNEPHQEDQDPNHEEQPPHNEDSLNKENPPSNQDTTSQQQECTKSKDEAKIFSSNNSEKVHLPSSHLINQSEDLNPPQSNRYKILKPTDNKATESEYVFSENFNIDNISSNNEPLFEFQKPKADIEEDEDKKNK